MTTLVDRVRRLSVSGLADEFDKLGLIPPVLANGLQPIGPPLKFGGLAFCIQGRTREGAGWKALAGPRDSLYDSLDERVPLGAVVVFDTGAYDDTAVFGGGTGLALRQRGCAGVIVDGAVRDVEELSASGLPVRARAISAIRFMGRFSITEIGAGAQIRGLAGPITVESGDLMLADHDGVISIPAAIADKVIAACEKAEHIEALVKAEVLSGVPRLEASRRHGKG